MKETIRETIANNGIVPVVVIEDPEKAVPAANALLAGGIDVIEITMRTAAGLQSIERIAQGVPQMAVMAGTVLSLDQCQACIQAGARGIVSPGLDPAIVQGCLDAGVLAVPGVVTPTEIQQAMSFGLDLLKFFPADVYGGPAALKSFAGPFRNISFIPTGGVKAANLAAYLSLPNVFAVGGSWICAKGDLAQGDYARITELTIQARQILLDFEAAGWVAGAGTAADLVALEKSIRERLGFPLPLDPGKGSRGGDFQVALVSTKLKRAAHYLELRGFEADWDSASYAGDQLAGLELRDATGTLLVQLQGKEGGLGK